MRHIPATLVAFDNRDDVTKTAAALARCSSMFSFDEYVFLTKEQLPERYKDGYQGAMRWELEELHNVGLSQKIFFVSDDGFIANPNAWLDEFLNYDMIGAPWPKFWAATGHIKNKEHRVGNTGFSIRSKRFLTEVAEWNEKCNPHVEPPDVFSCQTLAKHMISEGFTYAPPAIAGLFSFEHPVEEGTANALSFGFHGKVAGRTEQSIKEMLCRG